MNKIHCGIDVRLAEKSADLILAEETKKIAIEFAKKLMETKIYACREGKIGNIGQTVSAKVPPEFSLMKGELVLNGDKLFDKFIEEYYE